jgi:hypothetical protein
MIFVCFIKYLIFIKISNKYLLKLKLKVIKEIKNFHHESVFFPIVLTLKHI